MNQFDNHTYIAYNKPKGVICTTEQIPGNIIESIAHEKTLLPVGRLDKDSEGLILLTDNAAIINRIIHPDFKHEKEYIVTLNLPLRNEFIKQMATGVDLGEAVTKPCKIKPEAGTRRVFRIILTQGLNRQIRRMCAVFNYQVIKLQRVRIMHIKLGKLKEGEWRELTNEELELLFAGCL
ncbi:MAG: pseudouridine synthase [Bacteroidetes bacterium]|jgi:23S rRNA pseudouridine2604 synthase|nr:pseudouridine synthase [Bacteroidota bacterium]